ncbi:Transposase [Nitrosococcus oceani ATCC 19707]|uniref:Transposase n=2 Tax=Nitrosococcus oceani TaxID=1229 RepID=Q3J9P3_NITOC|nr:RNA-guided endonuclease TnpB family protein [Nitrosococcus oceani]ABA58453.1 Transposase [Nitrosococcus oceani ATCC 19707]EDZ66912.1 transposase, IS605 family [Nitrosococcus oceani AFC27]KFI19055.1 transposase [Nitrosococcus oceani C-27]GEM18848.1 transposase [Nitrosococcus oceani]
MKAYQLRLYPTLRQRRQLEEAFSACRYVWNWALDRRTRAYKEKGESLNAIALSRALTALKKEKVFLKAASATALTYVLKSQDEAFQKFFNKQARYPKFKRRGRVHSCTFQLDKRRGEKVFMPGQLLRLPKLGPVRVVWSYQDIPVFPNSATVSCNACGQWFVSLQCDCIDVIHPPATDKTIGLDLGLSTLIAMSDGRKEKPRRFLKNALRRLRFAQRRLSKTAKGGSNRRKQRSRVARLHQRIASKRANFLHGLSTSIVRENQAIAIEDLNVRGVMANGKLARSVGDCGWYELRRQLTYKAKWYGRQLNVVPRFQRTTGVCPDCGTVGEKLPLRVRSWTCGHCGSAHDRDIAAARVIDLMGNTARSAGIDACGLAHKPEEAVS